jgi:NADP-dependent 3-hydroxy acid dehydrogenase YdfG
MADDVVMTKKPVNKNNTRESLSGKLPGYFLGKVVVVTGASSGIGRSLAFWYLNNGAKVALVGRDLQELDDIGKQFPS